MPRRRQPGPRVTYPSGDVFTDRSASLQFQQAQSNLRNAFLAGDITWAPQTDAEVMVAILRGRTQYRQMTSRDTSFNVFPKPTWITSPSGHWVYNDSFRGIPRILGEVRDRNVRAPAEWGYLIPNEVVSARHILVAEPVHILDLLILRAQTVHAIVGARVRDEAPARVDHGQDAARYLARLRQEVADVTDHRGTQRRTIVSYDPGVQDATIWSERPPTHPDHSDSNRGRSLYRILDDLRLSGADREQIATWFLASYREDVQECLHRRVPSSVASVIADQIEALRIDEMRRYPLSRTDHLARINAVTREALERLIGTTHAIFERGVSYHVAAPPPPSLRDAVTPELIDEFVRAMPDLLPTPNVRGPWIKKNPVTPALPPPRFRRIKMDD